MNIRKTIILFLVSVSFSALSQKKIELRDVVVDQTFSQKTVSGLRSMNDRLNYTTLEEGNKIVRYSYKTGNKLDEIFNLSKIEAAPFSSFSDYSFSSDETKILFTTQKQAIYRHSFSTEYYIWNLTTKEMTPLSVNGAQQLATFSPDGERVAFFRENNLFVKSLKFGTESQVTRDGNKNEIINGAP
ncbi:MAG: DPP IV N-terminal domain-containing protein, partial [Bacteroidota bacterium]|nr:DPP IV N-terminal domain-containing protein [Bacteroidota bacterium]